jgi:predicted GH43/DUF377 family glycosyl hydrolase
MTDLALRFAENPLLRPEEVCPSNPDLRVECLLNPGVFRFEGRTALLVRVAERPAPAPGRVRIPFLRDGRPEILDVDAGDPDLDTSDPREFKYRGEGYLSTLSHLRMFVSDDGIRFEDAGLQLHGQGDLETFGIEDCRVASLADGRFLLTYTAVSANGYGPGLRVTRDWAQFESLGMILPPSNKDVAIFEETVGGLHYCLHRPSGVIVGGHYIWIASSPDLRHWGGHHCIARTRAGLWDSSRVGAGAAPIRTPHGWLVIYHGADDASRYRLGAMLLDLERPWKVLARPEEPLMEPAAPYEREGFFNDVVFTNGHLVEGDRVTLYYGAADRVICGAHLSLSALIEHVGR